MRRPMLRLLACLSLFFFLVPVTYVRGPVPPANDSQYLASNRYNWTAAPPPGPGSVVLNFSAAGKSPATITSSVAYHPCW